MVLVFIRRERAFTLEMLSSIVFLLAGLIQLLSHHWLHLAYIPFLVALSVLYGPDIMLPLSLTVPLLEVRLSGSMI